MEYIALSVLCFALFGIVVRAAYLWWGDPEENSFMRETDKWKEERDRDFDRDYAMLEAKKAQFTSFDLATIGVGPEISASVAIACLKAASTKEKARKCPNCGATAKGKCEYCGGEA